MNVQIKVDGFADLERRLQALDLSKQAQAIKAAGRFAMKPVLDDAKANAPVRSGLTRDQLRVVSRTTRDPAYPFEIGLTMKKKVAYEDMEGTLRTLSRYRVPNARASLANSKSDKKRAKGKSFKLTLDASWRLHFIETGAPNAGQPARPFIRPAMERNKEQVTTRFRDRLNVLVERLARQ